jgi:fructose 1,6-bisphosphate aldolase/phosphatase
MPVALEDSTPSRFDGPPRVICLGFQLNNGKLVGPRDMFSDKAFDMARQQANEMATMMRRHGPFEPHRLPLEEMEYTTMPQVMEKLNGRFKDLDALKNGSYQKLEK